MAKRIPLLAGNYLSAKVEGKKTGDFDIARVHPDSFEEFYILLKPTTGIYRDQWQVLSMKTTYGSGTKYQYPLNAPLIKFETAVYHTNISTSGSICLDILKDATKWMPTYDFTQIVMNIVLLYQEPNNSSPFNGEASRNYVDCEARFKEMSRGVADFKQLEVTKEECFRAFKAKADSYASRNDIQQYAKWFPQIAGGQSNDAEIAELTAMLESMKVKKENPIDDDKPKTSRFAKYQKKVA